MYRRIADRFINTVLRKYFIITKKLAFSVKNVLIPSYITVLTKWFDIKKIRGNKYVDREIIEYLKNYSKPALILIAADNDYAEVLRELKQRGIKIIVIGHTIAKILIEIADEYYVVDLQTRQVYPVK